MTTLSDHERGLLEAEAARQAAHDASGDPAASRAWLSAQLEAAGGLAAEPPIPIGDFPAIGLESDLGEGPVEGRPWSSPASVAIPEADAWSWNRPGIEVPRAPLGGDSPWGGALPEPAAPLAANPPQVPDQPPVAVSLFQPNPPPDAAKASAKLATPGLDTRAIPGDSWSSLRAEGANQFRTIPAFPPSAPDLAGRDVPAELDLAAPRDAWNVAGATPAPARARGGSYSGARAQGSESGASLSGLLEDLEKLRAAARRTALELDRIRGPVQPALSSLPSNHGSFRI